MSDEGDGDRSVLVTSSNRALASLVGGRVEAVHFHPETGLLALLVYVGEKRWLGLGLGDLQGVAWLPRAPRFRIASTHPVVAALRAHVMEHRIRTLEMDHRGVVTLQTGEGDGARTLEVCPNRSGYLALSHPQGATILEYPPNVSREGARVRTLSSDTEWTVLGDRMVARSDRLAAEKAHVELVRAISRRIDWLERRFVAVQSDLARLESVARLQKIGRLLIAQGPRIPRGSTRATLEDWEEGGTIEITLDPAHPARAQADVYFHKARRLQRGEAFMRKRLDETAEASMQLQDVLGQVRAVDLGAPKAFEVLDGLAVQARAMGAKEVAVPSQRASGTTTPKGKRLPYNLFRSEAGKPILVGRGGRDNDALLSQFARPHDLWLHARNVTGAHVIVPIEKGQSCPAELLVDAATLALHFSDARNETAFEVTYTDRRYVRKPKGSAPGAVLFDHDKVIVLRTQADRLMRLLGTRDESL